MKRMTCPLNGVRNISEFICGGEVTQMPDPQTCSDREWAAYLFMRENIRGLVGEWWMHVPTSYWFIAERDTLTNEIISTCPASEYFKGRTGSRDESA